MMRIACLITCICMLVCCHADEYKTYRLSDERMAQLMLDLQLAEVTLPDLNPQQQDSVKLLFGKKIEEIYHLSYADLKKEMELLQTDPKKLKLIVDRAKQMADSIQ